MLDENIIIMKRFTLLFISSLFVFQLFSATIYVTVRNVNSSTISGATVKLYDNSWNYIKSSTTNSSGQATFAALNYGTYNYTVYYQGDALEYWGYESSVYINNPTLYKTFYRDWPYRYSYSISSSSVNTGQKVTISISVKNKFSSSLNTKVELYVDRNQTSPYDYNSTSSSQSISANGTKTFTFNYTPTLAGAYKWKIRVKTYSSGSGVYEITDSYYWASAFSASTPEGDLYVDVKNVNGQYVVGASVKLFDDNWNYEDTENTNSYGKATFDDIDYGTYNYEVYYTGDTLEFWGSDENFTLSSSTLQRVFTRNWPYRHTDNLASITYVDWGSQANVEVTVKNNLSFSRDVKVELFIDKDKSGNTDFYQLSSSQSVGGGNTKKYTFNVNLSDTGTYYYKLRIHSFNSGSNKYRITDSYFWQNAFKIVPLNGQLDVEVRNVNSSPVSNATVKLYYNDFGNLIASGTTNTNGKRSFNLDKTGEYKFEVFYQGDTLEYWGYKDPIGITTSNTKTIVFTRDWPYRYDDNLASISNIYLGESLSIEVEAKNPLTFSRDVKIELWVDRNKSSGWDYYNLSSLQSINSKGTKKFTFILNDLELGDYYYKLRVHSYSDGSNSYIITDSKLWESSFSVVSLNGQLDIEVKNSNNNLVENSIVRLFYYDFGNQIDSGYTNSNGKISFNIDQTGDYMFEVYYNGLEYEYWGYDDDITFSSSNTKTSNFKRKWPYLKEFDVSNSQPSLGENVEFDLKTSNDLTYSRDVIVKLWVDRDKQSPYDKILESNPTTILPILNKTFNFDYKPIYNGEYYCKAIVKTYSNGSNAYIITDSKAWENEFAINTTQTGIPSGRIVYHSYYDYCKKPIDTVDGNIFIYNTNNPNEVINLTNNLPIINAMNPHFSPDGSTITFMAIPNSLNSSYSNIEIFTFDLSRNKLNQLTNGFGSSPSEDGKFSSAGNRIVYKHNKQIYLMNVDGSSKTQLTYSSNEKSGPNFSPNGLYITYWDGVSKNSDIYLMNVDGSNPKKISGENDIEDIYPIFINNDTIVYFSWISETNTHTYLNIYSISQDKTSKVFINNYNSDNDYADPFPINDTLIGISTSPSNLTSPKDFYDIAFVNIKNGNFVQPPILKTDYQDIGGWYSPYFNSNKLKFQSPYKDTSIIQSSQLRLKVKGYSNGKKWYGANIQGELYQINTNSLIKISKFNDDGKYGDIIINDGIYSVLYEMPSDTGKYILKVYAEYVDNGIVNRINTDSIVLTIFDKNINYSVEPNKLDFNELLIGNQKSKTLKIHNDGNNVISGLLSIEKPFSIVGNGNITINPYKSIEVIIQFDPISSGIYQNSISLNNAKLTKAVILGSAVTKSNPPILYPIPDHSIISNSEYNGSVPRIISGSSPITFKLIEYPSQMSIDSNSGEVYWEKPIDSTKAYQIIINASNEAGSTYDTFILTVLQDTNKLSYCINGRISYIDSSIGIAYTSISISGDSVFNTFSDAYGFYLISNLERGNYCITPNQKGYFFTPDSIILDELSSNLFQQDFLAIEKFTIYLFDTTFSISENPENGSIIGDINVVFSGNYSDLKFRIDSGNVNNTFMIDENNGILYVNDSTLIDHEKYNQLKLKIKVSDNSFIPVEKSSIVTLSIVDINDFIKENISSFKLKLYPNPTNGNIHIESEIQISKIEIYNAVGKLLYYQKLEGKTKEIELAGYERGIYFMRIITLKGDAIKKVIKF